jgi:hypothetical protein
MSRIISPTPLEITITLNEVTGKVDVRMTREVPYPTLVAMLCTILIQYGAQVMSHFQKDAGTITGAGAGSGPVNTTQKGD